MRPIHIYFFILYFVLQVSQNIYSQQVPNPQKIKSNINDKKYIVKTHPLSFVFGRQFVEVERKFNNYISLQFGLGLTFDQLISSEKDIYELEFENISIFGSINFENSFDIEDKTSLYRVQKPGYFLSANPRIFFNGNGFDGMFFSPGFSYIRYNFDKVGIVENLRYEDRSTSKIDRENSIYKEISIRLGYQATHLSGLTFEYFLGYGYRYAKNYYQDLGYEKDIVVRKFQTITPENKSLLEGGIRIGYLF